MIMWYKESALEKIIMIFQDNRGYNSSNIIEKRKFIVIGSWEFPVKMNLFKKYLKIINMKVYFEALNNEFIYKCLYFFNVFFIMNIENAAKKIIMFMSAIL